MLLYEKEKRLIFNTKDYIKYSMGHTITSTQLSNTYQAPDRPMDVTAITHGLQSDTTAVDYHSSVSWESQRFDPTRRNLSMAERFKHPKILPFLDEFAAANATFTAQTHRKFDEFLKAGSPFRL